MTYEKLTEDLRTSIDKYIGPLIDIGASVAARTLVTFRQRLVVEGFSTTEAMEIIMKVLSLLQRRQR